MRRVRIRGSILVVGLSSLVVSLTASDWPQYRGPLHDGSSPETLRTDWNLTPPTVLWRKALEPAWSSISVQHGRAYTQVNRRMNGESREVCLALDAATGAELWSANLDTAYYPDGGTGRNDGPRSTPTVDGDRVYVLTSYLKLYCLRADNGAVIWRRDFLGEFPGNEVIDWQNAASPLLVGDFLYLNSNVPGARLTAVRTSDGVTAWSRESDRMTHATPTYATIADVPQVVFLTARGLVGVAPESGAVLWRYEFSPSATSTAATPVVADDVVYASCAYALGAWTARITRSGGAFDVTQTDFKRSSSYQNHWATPVHHQGHLYSVVERSFRSLACFDLTSRSNRWITSTVGSGNPGFASLIKVGGKILVLTEGGELVLLEPNAADYTEIGRFQALSGICWNHPAFSEGRIFARSDAEMVVLDVAPPVPPLPQLRLLAERGPDADQVRLRILAANDGDLPDGGSSRIVLQRSPVPGAGGLEWTEHGATWTVVDGAWMTDIPLSPEPSLFRVAERPRS